MPVLRFPPLALFAAILAAPGCGVDVLSAGLAPVTGAFERTLTVDGPVNLDIRTGSGAIDIRTGPDGRVRIVGHIRAHAGFWGADSPEERVRAVEASPPIEHQGNDIDVGWRDTPPVRNVSISYEVTVPRQTRVSSRSGSGNQTIDSVAGPVEASAGSGDIRVGRVDGQVTVRAGSGDIDVEAADGGLRARVGSGSITARRVTGRVAATAGSGDIQVAGFPADDWVIRTGSGDIQVQLPVNGGFDLDARTGSGSISAAHPIEGVRRTSDRHLDGQVRGGGARIALAAGSGSIRID